MIKKILLLLLLCSPVYGDIPPPTIPQDFINIIPNFHTRDEADEILNGLGDERDKTFNAYIKAYSYVLVNRTAMTILFDPSTQILDAFDLMNANVAVGDEFFANGEIHAFLAEIAYKDSKFDTAVDFANKSELYYNKAESRYIEAESYGKKLFELLQQ